MNAVTLPPDLERFVADVVAQGRYSNLDDVARAAFSLLQRAEGERDGFFTIEEVLQEMDEIIEATERRRG